jgi:very-short-patch-repair endonuclease
MRPYQRQQRARKLRREMSLPEVLLWQRLRRPESAAVKFRRQHAVGPYVLDFYCAAAKLCVEVDGEAHADADRAFLDARRDESLARAGVRTLRIAAAAVLHDPDQIAAWICDEALGTRTPLTDTMEQRYSG